MIYKCAGRFRIDPETDEPICTYQSEKRWRGPCPSCCRPYNCDPIGVEKTAGRKIVTAAQSIEPGVAHEYIQTGVGDFDSIIGPGSISPGVKHPGGVVKSQVILLAGPQGSRKTSIALMVEEGLTKHTTRHMAHHSAEQNDRDLLAFCQLVGVVNEQVRLFGNSSNIHEILSRCDEDKPFATVFDSLQAIATDSGMTPETVATMIARYSKRTSMISIIISQMTAQLNIKSGTGAPHIVDTLMTFEPYRPSIDGTPRQLFGKRVAREIGYDAVAAAEDDLPHLRVLIGGSAGKNRYGDINQRAYVWTPPGGGLRWLKKKPPRLVVTNDDEDDED